MYEPPLNVKCHLVNGKILLFLQKALSDKHVLNAVMFKMGQWAPHSYFALGPANYVAGFGS